MNLERYFGLSGRTVLITGSTGGIGTAMAEAFSAAGANLVMASNDAGALRQAASVLQRAIAVPCDVADRSSLTQLIAVAEEAFGGIDVLVCNAGIAGPAAPLGDLSDADRDSLFRINLEHPRYLASHIAPKMAARGGGSIILTASLAGLRGNARLGTYGMTKAALIQLGRNLAVEWGPSNVRANSIAPGLINTSWASEILSSPQKAERRLSLTPLRRVGEPSEVAAAALFLASPGAAFITGQCIVIDGGALISDGN